MNKNNNNLDLLDLILFHELTKEKDSHDTSAYWLIWLPAVIFIIMAIMKGVIQ